MRYIGYALLFALIAFGLWPYYSVFRLDDALGRPDVSALQELVDLPAIRANYKKRLTGGLDVLPSQGNAGGVMAWLQQNLQGMGDAALSQAITLEWVRDTLRQAATEATSQRPAYLIAGVTFAFFESYDTFLVRVGELGRGATHIRMRLEGYNWRVTDIIR
jgi:hypothetical protein